MLWKLAIRNAIRNRTRTLLTASTVMLGTALLTVAIAWLNGVFNDILGNASASAGHVRIVDIDFEARERLNPIYENLQDVAALQARVEAIDGVVAVMPRIITGALATTGEEIGDNFGIVMGAPIELYSDWMNLSSFMVEGEPLSGGDDEVVIGGTLAEKLGASVGDELVLLGQTQDGSLSPVRANIRGIAKAGSAYFDQGVFLDLKSVQWMTDIEGGSTELLIYGSHRDMAGELAERIRQEITDEGLLVQAWNEREPWVTTLALVGVIHGILGFIIVFITALGVWNTMLMSVLERTKEIGVMRALGLSRLGTVAIFVVEALMISILGGGAGVVIGGMIAQYYERTGITFSEDLTQKVTTDYPFSTTMYADMNMDVALFAFGLGLSMAIIGSVLPALRAASIQPIEAMRTEH
jgi:putative ABC transport system permease protein